jgi:hypothetical protein
LVHLILEINSPSKNPETNNKAKIKLISQKHFKGQEGAPSVSSILPMSITKDWIGRDLINMQKSALC